MHRIVSPYRAAADLPELWSPRVIAVVNDAYVKVAKVQGMLGWHAHAEQDELFLILSGQLRIELEDGVVDLAAGELFVVPRGVRHNPIAEHECHVLLVEHKSTEHTGDLITDKTRSLDEQLRPLLAD